MIAEYLSGIGIAVYALLRCPQVHSIRRLRSLRWARIGEILSFSTLTCVQQSVMNLGILTVQGLVNSSGTVVMAAFAAAVKIDAFAYIRRTSATPFPPLSSRTTAQGKPVESAPA